MNTHSPDITMMTTAIRKIPGIKPEQIQQLICSLLARKTHSEFVYVLFWADWCKFCTEAKIGFMDLLNHRQNYDLPTMDIYQCEMDTIQDVRRHPEIMHPDSPWPEEKITITSIPTTVLLRVSYEFPSIFANDKAMNSAQGITDWITDCINES